MKFKLNKSGFVEVKITKEMLEEATKLATKNYVNTKNSLLKGEGNIIGALGEVVFKTVYPQVIVCNTFDYDFILNQKTIDIKTKTCNSTPQPEFDNSIFAYQKQKCDEYVFIRILKDNSKAWILGSIPKVEYYKKATFIPKGHVDSSNGFVNKADKYNLKISELNKMEL